MKKWLIPFLIVAVFSFLGFWLIFSLHSAQAQSGISVTGRVESICGNGIVELEEVCDDGVINNGQYGYCNSGCSGLGPYCGDGTTNGPEECDDGNNNSGDGCSATCQDEEGGQPGGGGGGGWIPPPVETKVIIKGKAYPEAKITLLQDGILTTTKKADSLADFNIEITDITSGVWTFSLWAEDKQGRKSITFSFTVNVLPKVITTISGIFLPPTIELSKVKFQRGETLAVYGQTAPESEVSTHIESSELIKKTKATKDGDWSQDLNTGFLDEGMHTSRAKAVSPEGLTSSFSQVLAFYVGEIIPGVICPNADFNGDGRVNLVDFSILLHWWGKSNPCVDQNQDGIVSLPDFSIMLYYWTG